ncbi:N-acetylmuramic acid 6-phosphate etherase [Lactobacillus amylovorus]|jgi:N-acetylmuramic acid 6-phosphate etherase|uniref:N-acetylmuramic acid 6-phosphate etherase n=1 Tax=Lactobacillus amylovorus TaxID=1604 RepID=A0AAW6B9W2_LACAM|nr:MULTISPECIES: N-acetylmuramic acid 6-phosphate etherase [Lactobacillus]MBW7985999.1 N-acetylmuramic acid 6-phosphate etherase [Lactobacillus helveticus]MBW8037885.1 N-acetylmuramic acid 6-phosphate etherase [Lactobacillus helveticus]MCT3585076.1 N-acetylmuramic acid 6-phosphate etherase [Lactobacillus amylovorus]MDA6089464.1 N-acetylmuramic acid 6-phosphate etherase [Lactobacillus amylovorus]MDB6246723.1 N-acetylmuramic acid 6-phosphate etherase [Lactobacillus amylovorus]
MSLDKLTTEQRNANTTHIDTMSTLEMVKTINNEDEKIAPAVGTQDEKIAQAIDIGAKRYHDGGRLIYIGAGTSGRLGVLDAVELVPTYGIKPERAIGLIAGGKSAMYLAVEGAEDDPDLAEADLKKINLSEKDMVLGIAASGRTPYVIGGLDYAKKVGAATVAVACVKNSLIGQHAEIAIEAVTGPEVVTGSTRMKAGTAQKMILNMISTGIMIRQGKVYENVMIDVLPTNEKLVERAKRIISTVTGISKEQASHVLKEADKDVGLAIVMAKTKMNKEQAETLLAENHGNVSDVLKQFDIKI